LHLPQSQSDHGTAIQCLAGWTKCPLPIYLSAYATPIHNNNYNTHHGNNKNQKNKHYIIT